LDLLKGWLSARKQAFSPRARAFGLPAPKGALLIGPPGTGKSLVAKCIASAWGMPLLRLDMGALKSKWVGESEANIRKALQVAEAVSPCVLWLDEIEKALGGSTSPQGDGGVAADALGAVLSWMQERVGSVFVIATANDVRALPPELMRKGRFDEVFFLDLPTAVERSAILASSLRQFDRAPDAQIDSVARATAGFTGAELSALVPDALFVAFAENERAITSADLLEAAKNVVPQSKSASEKLEVLRTWAKGRARPASTPEAAERSGGRGAALDVDDV
jgi:SpoVK/Ycf46/Vps4 family AAA+-type ATPase